MSPSAPGAGIGSPIDLDAVLAQLWPDGGRQREVDEHARARARLVGDVWNAAGAGRDRGATARKVALVIRTREDVAEAAARIDPAHLCHTGVGRAGRRRGDAVDGARVILPRRRVCAEVCAADAGHERVGSRPLDSREREGRVRSGATATLADEALLRVVGDSAVT